MITSVFKKSTPLNFLLVGILMLFFFTMYQSQDLSWLSSSFLIIKKGAAFIILLASILLVDLIARRNGMSKDSSYTIFFCMLLLLFFPSIFDSINLLISNFFILLALRRLIVLKSLNASKEKIFDASFWIFVAALFHFWSIVFIILVFISIITHVHRDYRNWILPFIALFLVGILFMIYATFFNLDVIQFFEKSIQIDFEINYFTSNYQNAALSIYATIALFFLVSMFATLSNRPKVLHSSYNKIIVSFFLGVILFFLSANKSNDLLLFTTAPLAIMATAYIEIAQEKLNKEIVIYVLTACSMFAFFSQL